MIGRIDIDQRVREWNLRADIVEKDYVLGWLLWGIGTEPVFRETWAFKGGTCLKKCFLNTFRFSEDLDFTILPSGPVAPKVVSPALQRVLTRVSEVSGIDFSQKEPLLKAHESGLYTRCTIYFAGPRGAPNVGSVRLDLMASEKIVRPTQWRSIDHPYQDQLPLPATVLCYSFAEVFAEKLRALGERARPRDLYDVVSLFRQHSHASNAKEILDILREKCAVKNIQMPSLETIRNPLRESQARAEWNNMLAHQLPALSPFDEFWNQLPDVFAWLQLED